MGQRQSDHPWQTLASRVVYCNAPYLEVREDKVIRPDGSEGIYSVIESKTGVIVIAQNERDEVYLIESFRYPLQAWRWEIPGGGIDEGDSPLNAAKKELEEELGLVADTWEQLGDAYPSNNGPMYDHNAVFLARDLHTVARDLEPGEAIRRPQAKPWSEITSMIEHGQLTDGQSLSALLYYSLWRGRHYAQ